MKSLIVTQFLPLQSIIYSSSINNCNSILAIIDWRWIYGLYPLLVITKCKLESHSNLLIFYPFKPKSMFNSQNFLNCYEIINSVKCMALLQIYIPFIIYKIFKSLIISFIPNSKCIINILIFYEIIVIAIFVVAYSIISL